MSRHGTTHIRLKEKKSNPTDLVLKFSVWSDTTSKATGSSPRQYCRRMLIVLWEVCVGGGRVALS